jgi:hypothetical protein
MAKRCRIGAPPAALVAAALLLLTLLAGCGGKTLAVLDANRARWEARGITTYEYIFLRTCFCGAESNQPLAVRVEGGIIVSVHRVDSGEAVEASQWGEIPTVDGMFDLVQELVSGGADAVRVVYDPELGYPAEVHVDYLRQAIDDEVSYYLDLTETERSER